MQGFVPRKTNTAQFVTRAVLTLPRPDVGYEVGQSAVSLGGQNRVELLMDRSVGSCTLCACHTRLSSVLVSGVCSTAL